MVTDNPPRPRRSMKGVKKPRAVTVTAPRSQLRVKFVALFLKRHLGCKLIITPAGGMTIECKKHAKQRKETRYQV